MTLPKAPRREDYNVPSPVAIRDDHTHFLVAMVTYNACVAGSAAEALKRLVLALAIEDETEIRLARQHAGKTLGEITASGWSWQ